MDVCQIESKTSSTFGSLALVAIQCHSCHCTAGPAEAITCDYKPGLCSPLLESAICGLLRMIDLSCTCMSGLVPCGIHSSNCGSA